MSIDKLLSGHRKFIDLFETAREPFVRLAETGQNPQALWIGCSDSRVIPEQILSAEPGVLFVVRNVANTVPPAGIGPLVGAAIEYAVLYLQVPHIIVCGHTECGGIKALDSPIDVVQQPHIARWIELARPAASQVRAAGLPEETRYLETIKANVLIQRNNLKSYRCVREALAAGELTTHGWLYDLHTGHLSAYNDETGGWGELIQSA